MSDGTRSNDGSKQGPQDPIGKLIAQRIGREPNLAGQSERFQRVNRPIWSFLNDYYFRLEIDGWDRIPDEPSLLIGIQRHST